MDQFSLSIVLPTKKMFEGSVSEVVLPAYDGEVGVLPHHENFVGILGSGPLKYIHEGKDYWLAISSGIYKVIDGKLTILAELAERGEDLNIDDSLEKIKRLEEELARLSQFTPEAKQTATEILREKARIEVYRRTHVLN